MAQPFQPLKNILRTLVMISIAWIFVVGGSEKLFSVNFLQHNNDENSILFPPDTLPVVSDSLKMSVPDSLVVSDSLAKKAKTTLEAKVERTANDSIIQDLKNKKVYLYGNAVVTYGDIKLEAAYIEFSFETNQVYARGVTDSAGIVTGTPRFTDKTQTFESKEINYNFNSKKGIINSVVTEDGAGFLHGSQVKKMADNSINIKSGGYTTCNNKEHPHFEFRFAKSKVIPDNKIVTGPAYLVIEGMPTPLAVPFGMFPNKSGQRSGIRIPTYGEADKRGFYFENGGYYWAINENIDLDILGDIYTRGSWALKPTLRYIKRYKYSGNLNTSYAINITGVEGAADYQKSRDFRIRWTHQQDAKAHPSSRFSANVNIVSSNFNTFNPVNTESYLSNEFQSSIAYQTNWNNKYFLTANASHRQNTKTKVVNVTLPSITFNTNKINPLKRKNSIGKSKWYEELNMGYTMKAENTISLPDSLLFKPGALTKMRNGIQHNIPINLPLKILKHFSLTNSINITDRMYFDSRRKSWVNDTLFENNDTIVGYEKIDTIAGFSNVFDYNLSTNLSTKVYGMVNFKKGPIRAIRHVVTPRVGFTYTPEFSDPKWNYYDSYVDGDGVEQVYSRYEGSIFGSPPESKSGRINFGISNNLEIKVRSKKDTITGMKKIPLIEDFSISGSYDLARDSLNLSYITMSGRTRLFKNFNINYSSSWDPYVLDSLGKQINKFEWTENKRLLRPTQSTWNFGASWKLSQKDFAKTPEKKPEQPPSSMASEAELNDIQRNPDDYVDWSIPWSLSINYNLRYSNNILYQDYVRSDTRKVVQTLGFSGDINITPKWKVSAQSGWDFENKGLSYTSLNIYRDLHCWEMRFSWVPIGPRKSWNFSLNVKASVLQDLKLTKKKDFRDI
ncbi:MAG: OstA family protein [Bacteroidetes bacterium]|nr:MAG: OstA family protein [Bacteroidota bacterium]